MLRLYAQDKFIFLFSKFHNSFSVLIDMMNQIKEVLLMACMEKEEEKTTSNLQLTLSDNSIIIFFFLNLNVMIEHYF